MPKITRAEILEDPLAFRSNKPGTRRIVKTLMSGTTGLLMVGFNPLSVDYVAAKMMGFDYREIPYLRCAFPLTDYPICNFGYNEIRVYSDRKVWNKILKDISPADTFRFKPAPGWEGHIEQKVAEHLAVN